MAVKEPPARILIPLNEVMATLGNIGRTTVYGLIEAEEIQRVKIGRRAFITARSLDAYLERLTQSAA